ncbi:MAG: nucleotidyl transferase AbiEii/AbiGii toxin family protein [Clostridia bacterium]
MLKVGTALYKILNSDVRFSEDIDLTVKKLSEDSKSSNQRRLEKSAFSYTIPGVELNKDKSIKKKDSVISFYNYDTVSGSVQLPLQRSGEIQIEATSFTVSEPIKQYTLEHFIYKLASDKEKEILENTYNIKPFEIYIIALERIFVDKIFAIEFYYSRELYFDASKHIFDICYLVNHIDIQNLLNNKEELNKLIGYKRDEESKRLGGIDKETKIKDFKYFQLENLDKIEPSFVLMQDKYVLNEKYKIDIDTVKDTLEKLYKIFSNID